MLKKKKCEYSKFDRSRKKRQIFLGQYFPILSHWNRSAYLENTFPEATKRM